MTRKWRLEKAAAPVRRTLLFFLCLTILASCKAGSGTENLEKLMDADSLARLEALPGEAKVLLSLSGSEAITGDPELGKDGARLGSFDRNWLVTVPRSQVVELSATEGLLAMVVWGDAAIVDKLDPRLRQDMLIRLSSEAARQSPLAIEARFQGDPQQMRENLEKLGAHPRSVNAGVATLDAPVDALFEILARLDLVSLSKPVLQRPLQAR
jgi:hypothetical protein